MRQIESVVGEKGWTGDQQLNQESSKGGGHFRKSPINLMEDLNNTMEDTKDEKKDKESPALKKELSVEDLEGIDGGGAYINDEMWNMGLIP